MTTEPKPLVKRLLAINNKNRRKIYDICLKENPNLTELSSKIGLSYNSTFENVKILEEMGFVKKVQTDKTEVKIVSTPKDELAGIVVKFLEELDKENES